MLQRALEHGDENYLCQRMSPCPYTNTTLITKTAWPEEVEAEKEARLALAISLNRQMDQTEAPYDGIEMWSLTTRGNKDGPSPAVSQTRLVEEETKTGKKIGWMDCLLCRCTRKSK